MYKFMVLPGKKSHRKSLRILRFRDFTKEETGGFFPPKNKTAADSICFRTSSLRQNGDFNERKQEKSP